MDNGKNRRMKTIGWRTSSNCLSRLSGQRRANSYPNWIPRVRWQDGIRWNIPIVSRRRWKRGWIWTFEPYSSFNFLTQTKMRDQFNRSWVDKMTKMAKCASVFDSSYGSVINIVNKNVDCIIHSTFKILNECCRQNNLNNCQPQIR